MSTTHSDTENDDMHEDDSQPLLSSSLVTETTETLIPLSSNRKRSQCYTNDNEGISENRIRRLYCDKRGRILTVSLFMIVYLCFLLELNGEKVLPIEDDSSETTGWLCFPKFCFYPIRNLFVYHSVFRNILTHSSEHDINFQTGNLIFKSTWQRN